jgi:hypothetical protein
MLEKTIEDILSADKNILSEILGFNPANLNLIARQKTLKSGKLDLLYIYDDTLVLIELKAVPFYPQIIDQINGYYRDLEELQKQNHLISAPILKIILVTSCSLTDIQQCHDQSIRLCTYIPDEILTKYFENFKELSYFLTIQPGDYGVVRLVFGAKRTHKRTCLQILRSYFNN